MNRIEIIKRTDQKRWTDFLRLAILMGQLLLLGGLLTVGNIVSAQTRAQSRIQPYAGNPFYWQYEGEPIMLLGGSDDDDLHNWTGSQLTDQLDLLASKGGNYIRDDVTSKDNTTGVYPFVQISSGTYDLDQWDEAWWSKIDNLLNESQQRDIIVSFEIWNGFAFKGTAWSNSPWNPKNNINYTEAGTGIPEIWDEHPSQVNSPFIKTVPGLGSNGVVLPYQESFVREFVRRTLPYDNALYVIQNESASDVLWSDYWATVLHNEAGLAGEEVEVADMRDVWDLTDPEHRYPISRTDLYTFIEISQNNQNPSGSQNSSNDQLHYDRIQYLRGVIQNNPTLGGAGPVVRPMNNVKIYGTAEYPSWDPGRSDLRGTERFWRNLFGGAASVRFHRPGAGHGLGTIAQANIQSARMVVDTIDIFSTRPDNSLLSNRSNDEAYVLAADSGKKYAVYFPGDDGNGNVVLDLASAPTDWRLQWLDVDSSVLGAPVLLGNVENVTLQRPSGGQWVALIVDASLPGDFDIDGDVDGADFLKWQRGFGSSYVASDLATWEANLGATAAAAATNRTVPEPTSCILVCTIWILVMDTRLYNDKGAFPDCRRQ